MSSRNNGYASGGYASAHGAACQPRLETSNRQPMQHMAFRSPPSAWYPGHTHATAHGVTMIELLVTMAIVAVMALIAYPAYQQYVLRANRAEAKTMLLQVASEQERHYTTRMRYTDQLAAPKPAGLGFASANTERNCYQISIEITDGGQGYTLSAVPQSLAPCGGQASDVMCGTLTLTSRGVKDATGEHGSACW